MRLLLTRAPIKEVRHEGVALLSHQFEPMLRSINPAGTRQTDLRSGGGSPAGDAHPAKRHPVIIVPPVMTPCPNCNTPDNSGPGKKIKPVTYIAKII